MYKCSNGDVSILILIILMKNTECVYLINTKIKYFCYDNALSVTQKKESIQWTLPDIYE